MYLKTKKCQHIFLSGVVLWSFFTSSYSHCLLGLKILSPKTLIVSRVTLWYTLDLSKDFLCSVRGMNSNYVYTHWLLPTVSENLGLEFTIGIPIFSFSCIVKFHLFSFSFSFLSPAAFSSLCFHFLLSVPPSPQKVILFIWLILIGISYIGTE